MIDIHVTNNFLVTIENLEYAIVIKTYSFRRFFQLKVLKKRIIPLTCNISKKIKFVKEFTVRFSNKNE